MHTSTSCAKPNSPRWSSLLTLIVLVPIACALPLLAGCATTQRVKLDPLIPHQVARPATVRVWSVRPDGKAVEVPVQIDAGWWVASPALIEPLPPPQP